MKNVRCNNNPLLNDSFGFLLFNYFYTPFLLPFFMLRVIQRAKTLHLTSTTVSTFIQRSLYKSTACHLSVTEKILDQF